MVEVSVKTLMVALRAVHLAMSRIEAPVAGNLAELEPDLQELMLMFSNAAMELEACYMKARESVPGLPPYEQAFPGG